MESRPCRAAGAAQPGAARPEALFFALLAMLILSPAALSQTPDDGPVRDLVAQLDRGETEAVRRQLPEFVAKYQNHPGVLYVQARVATDGIEAAKLYQSVIDNFPASEWADDALHHLYQYYYAMGLYKTAELKMQQLRKEYPDSEYLKGGGGAAVKSNASGLADAKPVQPAGAAPGGAAMPPAAPGAAKQETAGGAAAAGAGAVAAGDAPQKAADPGRDAAGAMPYTLQVGAFSTSENARKQKGWFEEHGYTAEIVNRVRGGKSLFLVWVGSFATADEARVVLRDVQSKYNITPIVVER